MDWAEKIRKRNRIVDAMVFIIVLAATSAVTLILFYRQAYGSPAMYHSDMKAYILEMQGLDSGYHFPYPVFFKLAAFIHLFTAPERAVAIATMLLNSLSLLVTKLAFNRLTLPALENGFKIWTDRIRGKHISAPGRDLTWLAGVVISLVSSALFFLSMLYPPDGIYLPGIKFKYLGVFTPNPFHNATYMAARPFAILAFLWYVKLLPVYENGVAGRRKGQNVSGSGEKGNRASLIDYVLFSLFLLLATMTKPSFTLVMVSSAGLLMLYRLFRAKFRNFVSSVQLGVCFLPTFLDLLYQYKGVFVPEDGAEGGVGFCLGEVWAQYCANIPLAVCLAIGFPLAVLVFNFRKCRKNTLFRFSWLIYLVSFAEAFLLYEKGFRKFDFNFSWGYMYGIFFCHLGALLVLLQITAEKMAQGGSAGVRKREGRSVPGMLLPALQWLAFLAHVVCGLLYFRVIFGGAMYY